MVLFFFFFKQKTAYEMRISDWSSDVCSSDLDAYQIIVVDNGSSDATRKIARSYAGVELLEEPQPGSYVARNRGIERVRAPITAFTDADCEPAPDWLDRILYAADRKSVV